MTAAVFLLATSVFKAVNAINEGNARGRQLHLMGAQADLEARQKALAYEQQANFTLRKLNATNAAAVARAGAGGVQAFEGSALNIQQVNAMNAGNEFQNSMYNASSAIKHGEFQMMLYASAANQAEKSGYFNAAANLAMAAYQGTQLGGPTPAPIEDRTANTQTYNSKNGYMI